MPIYEFVCQDCGYEFEKIQSFSDTSAPDCPQCAAENVVRQVSRPAIHFKGSGWYITDSKDRGKKPAAEPTNGTAGDEKSGDTTDATKESKAASKAETTSSAEESKKSEAAPVSAD